MVRVDVPTWLAALPEEIVTPEWATQRLVDVLAGVPLPPGFDATTLNELGPSDPLPVRRRVTRQVGCGWIAEWQRADEAGDAARQRAADALHDSHQWRVLHQMNDEGDWPRCSGGRGRGDHGQPALGERDAVSGNHDPAQAYRNALDCA